jgi:site-specific recombinase XerD
MCYKDEIQKKNAEKLQRKFDEENVPVFIQKYFINIDSKAGAINYWSAIKDLFLWLMSEKIIKKNFVSEISLDDFYDVESEDIKLYLNYKQESGMAKTTLNTRKHIFSSFWEYLVNKNKCPVEKNIVLMVKYKGKSTNNNLFRKLPSKDQLEKMEENIMKKQDDLVRIRNLSVLKVLKGTGIRESELAGLDLEDLYLDEKAYNFIGEMMPCIRIVGKGSYDKDESRVVYITGKAIESLKEWLEYRKNLVNIVDRNAVFINKNGKRLSEYNIQSIFRTYGDGVTPHMIRHWFATVMANTGNLAFAQQQLGHSSVDTTVNNYANGAYGMKDVLSSM